MRRESIAGKGRRHGRERGFVLITMAVAAIALIGVLGLAVDLGHMFISKNETQAYCDSAALAAALALDGTTFGIANAKSAVTNSTNSWNFGTTSVSSPIVTFATTINGPWQSNPSPATGYSFARVNATVPTQLYFIPVLVAQTLANVNSVATAAQVALTSIPIGLAPYTAVSTVPAPPNFGLIVGNSYDIHWPQFNSHRSGCTPTTPDSCFNSPPCPGDTAASKTAVVSNWGSSNSGFWGSNSNSVIKQQVLNLIQVQELAVGDNIEPVLTNGTKASEAKILDQRVSQDVNTTDNTVSGYLASAHNGQRLLAVPIVNPVSSNSTTVMGYGVFLLLANGPGTSDYYKSNTNGNEPYCAIYAGTYNIGSTGPGVGGASGGSRVKLVQ
ncbi:MAG: pilus assembly protein TadG-related protein [Acidobacteriota bacterium]